MQIFKAEMKLKGYTIAELSEEIGVTLSVIPKWLDGTFKPKAKNVKKLKVLGFSDKACLDPSSEIKDNM